MAAPLANIIIMNQVVKEIYHIADTIGQGIYCGTSPASSGNGANLTSGSGRAWASVGTRTNESDEHDAVAPLV